MRFILLLACVLAACSTEPQVTSAEQQLRSFEQHDRHEARTVYAALPPAARATLWTAQLDRALASLPLDAAQTELVTYVRDHLEEAIGSRAAQLEARAREVMPEDTMKLVFGTLGNLREPPPSDVLSFAQPACDDLWGCSNSCACSDNSCSICPVSGGGYSCTRQTCSHTCTATSSGCGWFWTQGCSGVSTYTNVDDCI